MVFLGRIAESVRPPLLSVSLYVRTALTSLISVGLGRGTAGVQEPGAAAGLGTRCCASHLCHSWSCADSRERLYDYCA